MPSNPSHPRPWRSGSTFGDGQRTPLCREQRARCRFLLDSHVRARRITAMHERIGKSLLRRLSVDGACYPSHVTLAHDAGCCERTVRRGLAAMRNVGLLQWQNRIVRVGHQVRQSSNAYTWNPAASPGTPLPRRKPRNSFTGHVRRETHSHRECSYFLANPGDVEALRKARLLMEKRHAATFASRHTR